MWFLDDDDDDEDLNLDDLPDDDEEEDDGDEEEDDSDDEEEGADEDDEEEEPKKSRGSERIRKINAARRESERKLLEANQKLDALTAQQNNQRAPQNNAAARAAYLASLPADQRASADLHLSMQEHKQMMAMQQFQMADTADKSAYDAEAINNPVYARYAARVEARLQELRTTQNITAPRKDVLRHILGDVMLKTKGKVTSKKNAKKSVSKNKVDLSSSKKTDMNGGVRRGKTPADRLAGVKF